MRTSRALIAAGVLALTMGLTTFPAAGSGSTECTDVLAPGTYRSVVVPEGAVCMSEGPVRIQAGLWIRPGATFVDGKL